MRDNFHRKLSKFTKQIPMTNTTKFYPYRKIQLTELTVGIWKLGFTWDFGSGIYWDFSITYYRVHLYQNKDIINIIWIIHC
jgi:hypothetical protein